MKISSHGDARVDYKDFGQNVNLIDGGSFSTPITYMPFTVGWDGTWIGDGRTTKLGLSANFHIHDLVGTDAEFANKRFKANSGYIYLRGSLSHIETTRQGWGVAGRGMWQIAAQPLINTEQSILGGINSVRGYYEVEGLGDDSVAGQLEIFSPNYAEYLIRGAEEFRLLTFLDGGIVRVLSPLPGQRDRLDSCWHGGGLRFKGWKSVAADFAWAVALEDGTTTKAGTNASISRSGTPGDRTTGRQSGDRWTYPSPGSPEDKNQHDTSACLYWRWQNTRMRF